MSRGLKRFFVICAAAAGVGIVLFIVGLAMGGVGNMDKVADEYQWFSAGPGEMKYWEHDSNFSSLVIKGDYDVRIKSGNHDSVKVGYGENMNPPTVQNENGRLIITEADEESWFTINLSDRDYAPFVEVTCSDGRALDSIDIETENGDVELSGIETGRISVDSDYGDVSFAGVAFDSGELDVENGDIKCTDIISQSLKIENEYGDCSLAGEIKGLCEVEMENGSLQIDTALAESQYSIAAGTDSGSLCIGDEKQDDYECRYNGGTGSNKLKLFSEYGDIKVDFGK